MEMVALEMTQKACILMSIDWDTFSTNLLRMLATYLQPEKANTKEKDHVADAVAPSFEDSQKQQPFKRQDHASSWTCSTCGNKGHHQYTCNQPSQPSVTAAKMVLLAKEEAAAKRQDKLHPKGKRKRIQEANIQQIFPAIAGREDQLVKAGRVHGQASYCWTCKTPPAG
jgi:hypothetical protein